jgi:hypothetical protein
MESSISPCEKTRASILSVGPGESQYCGVLIGRIGRGNRPILIVLWGDDHSGNFLYVLPVRNAGFDLSPWAGDTQVVNVKLEGICPTRKRPIYREKQVTEDSTNR